MDLHQEVLGCDAVRSSASRDSGSSFFPGFLVGGAIFGALGYYFAPQISKALLSEDQRLRLPRFLEEKKSPKATKQVLHAALATSSVRYPLHIEACILLLYGIIRLQKFVSRTAICYRMHAISYLERSCFQGIARQ